MAQGRSQHLLECVWDPSLCHWQGLGVQAPLQRAPRSVCWGLHGATLHVHRSPSSPAAGGSAPAPAPAPAGSSCAPPGSARTPAARGGAEAAAGETRLLLLRLAGNQRSVTERAPAPAAVCSCSSRGAAGRAQPHSSRPRAQAGGGASSSSAARDLCSRPRVGLPTTGGGGGEKCGCPRPGIIPQLQFPFWTPKRALLKVPGALPRAPPALCLPSS